MHKLYQTIARTFHWQNNASKRFDVVEEIKAKKNKLDNLLPSGSGFNAGSGVMWEKYNKDVFLIASSFYIEHSKQWCDFIIEIRPSLMHYFELNIQPMTEKDRKIINDEALLGLIDSTFYNALMQEVE